MAWRFIGKGTAAVAVAALTDPVAYITAVALSVRSSDESTLRLFDGALVAWMVAWVAVGVFTGVTLWQASDIGDTLSTSGEAIGSAGAALEGLGGIPLIGDGPAELGAQTRDTGEQITAQGPAVKGELRRLALLLAISISLIPTTPVLGLYLPLRLARRREIRDLRRSLRDHPDDPDLDAYLAQRALRNLAYADVRALVGGQHTADDTVDHVRRLADAELSRLGLSRHRV